MENFMAATFRIGAVAMYGMCLYVAYGVSAVQAGVWV